MKTLCCKETLMRRNIDQTQTQTSRSSNTVDWDPPSFESSRVLYITPTCTSSMQELIKQGMEQKLENCCFRCKNTWHVESNYILQPQKYFIIVVNRFRYINNSCTKDRSSIPMDMNVVLSLHKFRPEATMGHHRLSMYSGHYTASLNCCKKYKHSIATTAELLSLKRLTPKTPLLLMWWCIYWLHIIVFGLEQEYGSFDYSHGAGTPSPSN